MPTINVDEKDINTSLRSFVEVSGYHVNAVDRKIGQVIDFLVDDNDWQIVYAIVDTSKWMPWSRKVIIPISLFEEISYVKKQINTVLDSTTIKEAPAYSDSATVDKDYEVKLYDFFIERMKVIVES